MMSTWLSLLPPFITLGAALITKKAGRSLLLGIFSATFIISNYSLKTAIIISMARIWANTQLENLFRWSGDFNNLYIFSFLFSIGILIALINHTGGVGAYAQKILKRLKDKTSVETSSFLLSVSMFLDDYLSCLTVGCIMRPLTDRFNIPRAKLAYLIDSMAVPLIIMVPISSWVATITHTFEKSGISDISKEYSLVFADPLYLYTRLIPYLFYSLISITTVWFIIRKKISFGPMKVHEQIAQLTGNLLGGKEASERQLPECLHKNGSIYDFLVPIFTLIFSTITGLLYSGNYLLFGGKYTLMQAFQNADSAPVLFRAGTISLIISTVFSLLRCTVTLKSLPKIFSQGIKLMAYSNMILLFAWTFGDILKILHSGDFLAYLMIGTFPLVLLPCALYLVSALTATTIGSSWATMLVMIPIAVQMVVAYLPFNPPIQLNDIAILLPTLGAILSGAATGDHISPIASTTIMASNSSGANLMDHVKTQFAYAWPVILSSACAFLVAGLTIKYNYILNIVFSLSVGVLISLSTIWFLNRREKKTT